MCRTCIDNLPTVSELMRGELEQKRLEVVLLPAPDPRHSGHLIRAAQFASPEWYQEFCGLYESARRDRHRWRKFKTKIKRRDTVRGLVELESGAAHSLYAQRLKNFIASKKQSCPWRDYMEAIAA